MPNVKVKEVVTLGCPDCGKEGNIILKHVVLTEANDIKLYTECDLCEEVIFFDIEKVMAALYTPSKEGGNGRTS